MRLRSAGRGGACRARRSPGEARECPPAACSESDPSEIAFNAASWMFAGVSKSGSPSAKSRTSIPFAFNRLASAPIASVAEGAIKPERCCEC